MGAGLPLIVVAERQGPMRRAVRRLLGESRFAWAELDTAEALLERTAAAQPALAIFEDRLLPSPLKAALDQLRGLGCTAPVILISTGASQILVPPGEERALVVIDRLEISSRLPEAAKALLA